MSRVKDVFERARSLWLRVLRSTDAVDNVENDKPDRLFDGRDSVGTKFEPSRFDIETGLSRWESYTPTRFN
jgi:hypothetical protein